MVAEALKPFGGMSPHNAAGDPIKSSTVPELHAIEEAVNLLQGYNGEVDWAVIRSDSAAAINAVEGIHQLSDNDMELTGCVESIRSKLVNVRK